MAYIVLCPGIGTTDRAECATRMEAIAGYGAFSALVDGLRQGLPGSSLAQLSEALDAGAGMVLLDNMGLSQLQEAVQLNAGRAILDVSGGVNLSSVRAIASTGVDRISIGTLTKDIQAVDFSMRFATEPL
mgnify:CR=1 FL=1